jgi:hypothetical protein
MQAGVSGGEVHRQQGRQAQQAVDRRRQEALPRRSGPGAQGRCGQSSQDQENNRHYIHRALPGCCAATAVAAHSSNSLIRRTR